MASYRRSDFEERDTYYSDRPPRRGGRDVDNVEIYERERREERRSPPRRPVNVDELDVRVRDSESRVPNFMREDRRPVESGQLVLRQREVETVDRRRPRSPSPPPPVQYRERIVRRARSVSPGPPPPPPEVHEREEFRTRIVERERDRVRSPSRGPPMERMRPRFVERSPSPPMERVRTRIVERERERERSPSPPEMERSRLRIIEHERERYPSPSPSPPPPSPDPPVIRGPTIEREVITHYRDIDHGVIVARPPTPPPPPPAPRRTRDTEIDIYTSRNETEVDIHKTTSHSHSRTRGRSQSRDRLPVSRPTYNHQHYHDDEILVRSERDRLRVDIDERRGITGHRRAHSAAPERVDYSDEAEYITSKIDSRGRMGEAWHGATRDWTIVDVPPGTERVKMDGVGGGGAEVTWQRYNGVRRAKFIPERESSGALVPLQTSPNTSSTTIISERDRIAPSPRDAERDRLSVQIYDKNREIDVEKVTDRRISLRPSAPAPVKRSDMWTEITKDLVVREAIEEMGYEYEETEFFYYVMQYLRYEDVLQLVQMSDNIRRRRKDRVREIQWEREYRDEWERERHHHHHHSHSRHRRPKWDEDERIVEREVIYDRAPRYLR